MSDGHTQAQKDSKQMVSSRNFLIVLAWKFLKRKNFFERGVFTDLTDFVELAQHLATEQDADLIQDKADRLRNQERQLWVAFMSGLAFDIGCLFNAKQLLEISRWGPIEGLPIARGEYYSEGVFSNLLFGPEVLQKTFQEEIRSHFSNRSPGKYFFIVSAIRGSLLDIRVYS